MEQLSNNDNLGKKIDNEFPFHDNKIDVYFTLHGVYYAFMVLKSVGSCCNSHITNQNPKRRKTFGGL